MKSAKIWVLSFLLLVLGILIGLQIAVSPLMEGLTGGGQTPATGVPATAAPPPVTTDDTAAEKEPAQDTPGELTLDHLQQVLANADTAQRQQVLADAELFRRFVEQEATNRSLKAAAMANGVHENADVRFLMDRAGANVLRETYVNQLMQEQLPADFPSEDQVRQFYQDNPDQFSVKERVQVWQVFLQVSDDATPEEAARIERQARDLLDQIRNNKLTFAGAAVGHSAHKPSRQNDGYMGLVLTSELKPAIATGLQDLKEGELGLVRSDDGWHILKKGRSLAAEQLPFEEVRQQARQLLVNQARQQFRQAVNQEARKTYSFMPGDNRIEQWRLELKTAIRGAGSDSG